MTRHIGSVVDVTLFALTKWEWTMLLRGVISAVRSKPHRLPLRFVPKVESRVLVVVTLLLWGFPPVKDNVVPVPLKPVVVVPYSVLVLLVSRSSIVLLVRSDVTCRQQVWVPPLVVVRDLIRVVVRATLLGWELPRSPLIIVLRRVTVVPSRVTVSLSGWALSCVSILFVPIVLFLLPSTLLTCLPSPKVRETR